MRHAFPLAFLLAACSGGAPRGGTNDELAARFPLAQLADGPLCEQLVSRNPADHRIVVDDEPRLRRKVIVSDLHLGPGTKDPRFAGIEDFFSEAEWAAFLAREDAIGPTDLVIAGDFIEMWQIATALGAVPRSSDRRQPAAGSVLATDQDFAVSAINLVIDAHPTVFGELGKLLDGGDHRVIVIAGNHDAHLLWPRVQLAIARAISPRDPSRLVFVQGGAYEHGGVHVEHGHAFDAANKFDANHAPFGRDREGRCRLQSSWGEIFVDQFYTETEREIPFIDNLYPESAAILWAMRERPDPTRDLGAALRFVELIRVAETKELNRNAAGALLQTALGAVGVRERGPESTGEVIDHVSERLVNGDPTALSIADASLRLAYDPELKNLWAAIVQAAAALPDMGAALGALRSIDPHALGKLRDRVFGDSLETAAAKLIVERSVPVVVFGHTHHVGGLVQRVQTRGHAGFYANTGSWISVASVADLRARGVTWDKLSLADRAMFPSKTTAVIVEYDGLSPRAPIVVNAR